MLLCHLGTNADKPENESYIEDSVEQPLEGLRIDELEINPCTLVICIKWHMNKLFQNK